MNIILLLFSISPQIDFIEDKVDRIEQNYYFSQEGQYIFCQYIFWDWDFDEDCWVVVDWRLNKHAAKGYPEEELDEKFKQHQEFYTNLAIDKLIKEKSESLTRQGIKHTINREKFKEWYLSRFKIEIPPFIHGDFVTADSSIANSGYILFEDHKQLNKLRKIYCKEFFTTYTNNDPELTNREILPQDKRRGLTQK